MKHLWLILTCPPVRIMNNYLVVVYPQLFTRHLFWTVAVYRLRRVKQIEFAWVGFGTAPRYLAAHDLGSKIVWHNA